MGKNIIRSFFFTALSICLIIMAGCNGQKKVNVMHVRNMEQSKNMQGFFYVLPRTLITVDVVVQKTQHIKGPYSEFASKYLGLNDVITENSTEFEIEEIKINSFAEPDPNEFYFVEYHPKAFSKIKKFMINLNESGLIQSVNSEFDLEGFKNELEEPEEYGFFGSASTFNYFIESNLTEKIDTITEMVQMDSLTVERQTLRRSVVEKSSEQRAKEVADYILKIRNKKFDLISGLAEITYSKETLEYMMNQLEKTENDYLELFTGLSSKSSIRYRYSYLPEKDSPVPFQTLFRFSRREGVLPTSAAPMGEAVTIHVERNESTRQLSVFLNKNEEIRSRSTGFYYRIPEHAKVIIKKGNAVQADARILINQFGIITHLPANQLDIQFFPNTGSIKKVGITEQ